MRDTLPINGPNKNEAAIVNLDSINNRGTHWVAYRKTGSNAIYYDSFGNLAPPRELTNYLKRMRNAVKYVYYTYDRQQTFGTVLCGHLCLKFLTEQ